eukprot:4522644-Prymnesium_polylepis.1
MGDRLRSPKRRISRSRPLRRRHRSAPLARRALVDLVLTSSARCRGPTAREWASPTLQEYSPGITDANTLGLSR